MDINDKKNKPTQPRPKMENKRKRFSCNKAQIQGHNHK